MLNFGGRGVEIEGGRGSFWFGENFIIFRFIVFRFIIVGYMWFII